jgi:hypothetical protein
MKRYAVYQRDDKGAHEVDGLKYSYVTQVPGADKADAMQYVHDHLKIEAGFYVKYVGKWG